MFRAHSRSLSLVLALTACGSDATRDTYDVETWNSPLASQFDGVADPAEGERLYFEEHWTDDSAYAFTCNSCHGSNPDDSLIVDAATAAAGDRNRAAHTTWNAPWRALWKGGQAWDVEESDYLGAYGGQICVTAYFPSGAAMTAEQAAHLEAWMRGNKDDQAGDDPTAAPLDYAFNTWDGAEDFVATVQDADGAWLYGADLADVTAGQDQLVRYCGACHGGDSPVFYTAQTSNLDTLVARIRRTDFGEASAPNTRMPRLTWDRLSDADLRDLLAALTDGHKNN